MKNKAEYWFADGKHERLAEELEDIRVATDEA